METIQCQELTDVQYCARGSIEIGGQTLTADETKAYVEFRLSHSFPVLTCDQTTLHPNTVAQSYQSMLHQVFNVGHIMKAYNPDENYRDRILGSVVAVEFPPAPVGGWKVQGDSARSPGIRAVAVIHKRAEWADKILAEHLGGRKRWTVSMENTFRLKDGGFLVKDKTLAKEFTTPDDLLEQGWTYIPWSAAPDKLMDCFDEKRVCMASKWGKRDTALLIGGLGARIHYQGVGITPLGKEPTAQIATMLASQASQESGPEMGDGEWLCLDPARMAPQVE
jgi:hypothetical protein